MDAESLGRLAEATGKGVGAVWLIGHHGRNFFKAWKVRRAARLALIPPPGAHAGETALEDAQVARKESDEADGRLIREAVFNQLQLTQDLAAMTDTLALRDEQNAGLTAELARATALAGQYQHSANEWQEDADAWRKRAKEDQARREERDASWAALGTSYLEQVARVRREKGVPGVAPS